MFIKNYSSSNFVIKYKGEQFTLPAQDVSYVDENWISWSMLHSLYGDYVGLVDSDKPIEDFLFDNQTIIELDKVYSVVGVGPGAPRIFIKEGTATLYFAEGSKPESIDDMIPSTTYADVQGLVMLSSLTGYIGVKAEKGTKVIFTNIKVN